MIDRVAVVVGAVLVEDGRLLVVQRAKAPHAGLWAVPGGHVDRGETLVEAVVREVQEETGLDVEVADIAWVGETIGPGEPPEWHYVIVDFWATRLGGEVSAADDAARVEWVPIEELEEWPIVDTMFDLIRILPSTGTNDPK